MTELTTTIIISERLCAWMCNCDLLSGCVDVIVHTDDSDTSIHSMHILLAAKPNAAHTCKKIKKELKFKSRFRDGGYIIPVEKPNKQGKSQSTAHPQHHPIPKLLHATCTVDTQDKIKAIVEMRKRQATCSLHTVIDTIYLRTFRRYIVE